MPLLNKEVEDCPEDGSSDRGSSMSSEYRFRLQLMDDHLNDTPPPISPNSTAFDPSLRKGQVKIIRAGDTMHVLTYEEGSKPMITSYAKPLASLWREGSPRSRQDLSPIRSPFKFEGESAIRTISRYCFPSCIDAQLDNLTLQEILSEAQQLTEKWLNAPESGLSESHKSFLKNQFLPAKIDKVMMKDWERLRDIVETHHYWKIELTMSDSSPSVIEVSYKKSACLKSLPRFRLARKRKEDLKNYEAFVDMGERVDLHGLRRKRGQTYTYLVNQEKAETLAARSMYYSSYKTVQSRRKPHISKLNRRNSKPCMRTMAQAKVAKKKALKANRLLKNAKSDKNTEKLNPRRDKPMAKIRSQARKIDRFARMNGESFHNAALTLSKNRGLSVGSPNRRVITSSDSDAVVSSTRQSDIEPYTAIREKDLDLGLEGVCFDADVAELANSMVGTDLEDLEGLARYPAELSFPNNNDSGSSSMVEALHAGIDYVPEFPDEPFVEKSFQDITSMDDGLLDAIDTTLGVDIDVSNLISTNTTNSKEEIFLMTGLTAAEHSAFNTLGQQLISEESTNKEDNSPKKVTPVKTSESIDPVPDVPSAAEGKSVEQVAVPEPVDSPTDHTESPQIDSAGVLEAPSTPPKYILKSNTKIVDSDANIVGTLSEHVSDVSDGNSNPKIPEGRKSTPNIPKRDNTPTFYHQRRTMPSLIANLGERSKSGPSSRKAKTLLQCTLTGSYWQIPENKFPCNRPKRANAGALMTTKSRSKKRQRDPEGPPPTDTESKSPTGKPRKNSKIWAGKFTKKSKYSIAPDDMIVNKKTALRCVLSIPDEMCPTTHQEFLYKHRRFFGDVDMTELEDLVSKFKPKEDQPKTEMPATATTSLSSGMGKYLKRLAVRRSNKRRVDAVPKEDIKVEAETPPVEICDEPSDSKVKPQPVKAPTLPQPVPKPKPYARHKKFEEDEKTEIIKLFNNKILADGVVLDVEHENYVREKDVEIPYDDHEFLPPDLKVEETIETTKLKCVIGKKLPYCIYGCVCESIDQSERETKHHCGKPKCMLDCSCNASCWTKEDADIRSRLRPRVSMLNWSSRLNCLDALINSDNEKHTTSASKNNEVRSGQTHFGRIKRNIQPPKRNSDFVSHSPSKKYRDALTRPLARKTNKPPFNAIGNRLRLKQRQQFHRPLKAAAMKDDILKLKLKKSLSAGLGVGEAGAPGTAASNLKNESDGKPRTTYSRLALQRSSIQRQRSALQTSIDTLNAKNKRKLMAELDFSLEGTGPAIPPELMARFAPFMEIQFRPKPDRSLPLSSESEESTDDENDEDYAYITYKRAPIIVTKPEETFPTPVIVSYRSCQDGLVDIVYPDSSVSRVN